MGSCFICSHALAGRINTTLQGATVAIEKCSKIGDSQRSFVHSVIM